MEYKAARARRVRVEIAGGRITGALWFSVATLFTLDRSEPAGTFQRLDVGDRVEVRLRLVDPYRGFIDFQLL